MGSTRTRPRRARPEAPRRPDRTTRTESWALGLLVLGSVTVLPWALNRFVLPKIAVTSVGVGLGFLSPARGRLPRATTVLLGSGLVVLAGAALTGAAPVAQLVGAAPRYEGLVLVAGYLATGAVGARLLGPRRPLDADQRLLRHLSLVAVAVAVLAVAETLGLRPLDGDVSRPGSLLGNASEQGAWGVLVLGPLLLAALRRPTVWSTAAAAAAGAAVVLSGSRGALLGALVLLAVLLGTARDRRSAAVLTGAGLAILSVALAVPVVRERVLGRGLAGATVEGRASLWRDSWVLVSEQPVLGVGPNGFGEAVRSTHGLDWYLDVGTAHPPDSPHSWPLQALLAGGPLLLLLALSLIALTVHAAWQRVRTSDGSEPLGAAGLLAGLAGYGTALLVHFTSPGHTPLAALFGGALLAAPPIRDAARSTGARIVAGGAALTAAVTALGATAEIPLRRAVEALQAGDVSSAQRAFEAAEMLRGWDPGVAFTAGHALRVFGVPTRHPEALALAPAWLADSGEPLPAAALADLGAVRDARGEPAEAARFLDAALRIEPLHPDHLLLRGVVAARLSDWSTAERSFLAASRSAPGSPEPWQDLAVLYELTGRTGEAAAAQERAEALAG